MFNEIEENFDEDSDSDGEDHVEPGKQDSETEQEDDSNEEEIKLNESGYFFGKDKVTKWHFNPKSYRIRAQAHNIIRHLPGVIKNARNATSPLKCNK